MVPTRYPSLFQINARVWLTEISGERGRAATLDDIPDTELDHLAHSGFHWIWMLSAWQTGRAGQQVSRTNHEWRREFEETLPDLREEDIAGSGFAIIFSPALTTRTSLPVSWKTTTSRGQPLHSLRRTTRQRRSSHFYRPGCAFFTRASLRAGGRESHRTWCVRLWSQETKICSFLR